MANRFPLIVDTANVTNSIIKELPVGDTLDFNSSGIANLAVANLHVLGGTSGQFLQTDGSGNLSWTTGSGGSTTTGEYGIYKTNPSTSESVYLASGSSNISSTTYNNLAALQVTSVTVSNEANSAGSNTWYTTFYANGVYLKAVQNSTNILSSTDGTTWTTQTGAITNLPDTINLNQMGQKFAWNGNVYMAISRDANSPSNAQCQTSPDGITWTQRTNPGLSTSSNQYTIISHGTRFICYTYTTIRYSDDEGVTWSTGGSLPFSINTFTIGTNGTRLVAISSNGTQSAYSDNGGVSWTLNSTSVGGTSGPSKPVWNGAYWLVVYTANSNQTLSWSFDGLTWISLVGSQPAAYLGQRVFPVWTGKFWVTYGYNGAFFYRIFRHPWEAVLLQTNMSGAADLEAGLVSDGTGYTYVAFGPPSNTTTSVKTAKWTIVLPATFTVATPIALGSNTGTWYVKT